MGTNSRSPSGKVTAASSTFAEAESRRAKAATAATVAQVPVVSPVRNG